MGFMYVRGIMRCIGMGTLKLHDVVFACMVYICMATWMGSWYNRDTFISAVARL
jgi:hypothetical protein